MYKLTLTHIAHSEFYPLVRRPQAARATVGRGGRLWFEIDACLSIIMLCALFTYPALRRPPPPHR